MDEELEEKSSCWGTSEPLFNDMASQYAGCEVLKSENGGQTNRTKFNIDSPLPMNQSSQVFSFAKVLPAIKPSVNTLKYPSNSKNLIQRVRMSNLTMMAEA